MSLASKLNFLGRDYTSGLWVASGTYGWGREAHEGGFLPKKLGALVTKGVSPEAMDGAPHPRIIEPVGSGGVLNAIGLQNSGVNGFLSKYLPCYEGDFPAAVWVNVFAGSIEGYSQVIEKIQARKGPWLAGYELNVSCPNVDKGGAEFATDPKTLAGLVESCVKAASGSPIMVKLSPLVERPLDIAKACMDAGAGALAISNTLLSAAMDPERNKAFLGRRYGGLSGSALKPLSLRLVDQVANAIPGTPICGIGGISCAHDVLEFQSAGAQVVQVGTANFANPWIVDEIAQQLEG